jgi:hypothetical protein
VGEDDAEVDGKDLEEDEQEAGEEDADEDVSLSRNTSVLLSRGYITNTLNLQAADTAKIGGPAAAAKATKGKDVPKEASLSEVDDAE